mmetsp:Transcript_41103/g.80625  ORF Transcript_41103/g.80625 Transcript_41103/m.80625 type:complete len:89 (-) Transcript_41103:16-282(-)
MKMSLRRPCGEAIKAAVLWTRENSQTKTNTSTEENEGDSNNVDILVPQKTSDERKTGGNAASHNAPTQREVDTRLVDAFEQAKVTTCL